MTSFSFLVGVSGRKAYNIMASIGIYFEDFLNSASEAG